MMQSILNSEKLQCRLAKINKSGRRTSARLRALVTVLAEWAEMETTRDASFSMPDIAAEDIDALRSVIHQQLSRGRYTNITVLTDQILFIVLGALKARRHSPVAKTWELTMLSIESLLNHAYQPWIPPYMRNAYVALLSSLLLCGGYGFVTHANRPVSAEPANFAKPIFAQSPYIPTHVHSFRKIMLHANCEYPQAAMLPIEQRVAFLDFLRNGEFALADLKNLETALSRVDCFYASTINNSTIN